MRAAHSFRNALVNYYVRDVKGMADFYARHFGFTETFRTPRDGAPVHIELRLGAFTLGFASIDAAMQMHGLPLAAEPGRPRGEIALWTDDVDAVHRQLTDAGVPCISAPHNFIGTLRAAWFTDPEGNHIQIVARVG